MVKLERKRIYLLIMKAYADKQRSLLRDKWSL